MKLISNITFSILFLLLLIKCSSSSVSYSSEESYMPLSIGNKWYYSYSFSNDNKIISTMEVVTMDSISGKEYFLIKDSFNKKGYPINNYYHMRLSNDTLYTLKYDDKREQYIERVDAIFYLNENEEASIHLDINNYESPDEEGIERLPIFDKYKIKVILKSEDLIKFYFDSRMVDGDYSITYKKGIGIFEDQPEFGVGLKLQDYELSE